MDSFQYGLVCATAGSVFTVLLSAIILWAKNRSDFFGQLSRSEKDED